MTKRILKSRACKSNSRVRSLTSREKWIAVLEKFARTTPAESATRRYWSPDAVEHYGEVREVEIAFEAYAELPRISVDGPGSPHRFSDGSLCIWHPEDPRQQRGERSDGLFALIGVYVLFTAMTRA